MTKSSELTTLFTQLASHIQTTPSSSSSSSSPSLVPSISALNQSLNLNHSNSRVLDKALSLMCFKAPQVFDVEIKCLVDTIVTVLSSCVGCDVVKCGKEEFLRVGGVISSADCAKLLESFVGIAGKLEGYDTLKQMLLSAVLRVSVSTSCYQGLFPLAPSFGYEPGYQKSTTVSELQYHFPEEMSVNNHEIPLRLLLWYLDPMTLKHDISNILQELVERPFIDLKKELYEKMTWRSIILGLVFSPIKFVEMRTLLHNWFLITGLASILELQIRIVTSVLDVLAQPMQWSVSMEVGLKLPFSDAYFPNDRHLVAILTGPISGDFFLNLVHISGSFSHAEKNTRPTFDEKSMRTKMLDHKSTWATLMIFPEWFLFASLLLFSKKDCQPNFWTGDTVKTWHIHDAEQYCAAAARYLAYCTSPISEANLDLLVKYLIQLSESWTVKQCSPHEQNGTSGRTKRLRKPKICDNKKDNMVSTANDGQVLRFWVKDFHDCHMKYWTDIVNSKISKRAKTRNSDIQRQNVLFRKIPLGIIFVYNLEEAACELLFHYAATGEIHELSKTGDVQLKHDEAVAGVRLVFQLFDVVEEMSSVIFETEEKKFDFICHSKMKALRFMVKCINRLLQVTTDDYDCKTSTLSDLHRRLEEWRYHGGETIQTFKPLNDILIALNCKVHSQ